MSREDSLFREPERIVIASLLGAEGDHEESGLVFVYLGFSPRGLPNDKTGSIAGVLYRH